MLNNIALNYQSTIICNIILKNLNKYFGQMIQ